MIPGASNASGDRIRHSRETRLAPDQAPAGGVRGGPRAAAHHPNPVDEIAAFHLLVTVDEIAEFHQTNTLWGDFPGTDPLFC